jgi:hypothetical protein
MGLPYLEQSNFGRTKLDFSRFDPYFRWFGDSMATGETERFSDLSLSAILTSSGKDFACIFFMT